MDLGVRWRGTDSLSLAARVVSSGVGLRSRLMGLRDLLAAALVVSLQARLFTCFRPLARVFAPPAALVFPADRRFALRFVALPRLPPFRAVFPFLAVRRFAAARGFAATFTFFCFRGAAALSRLELLSESRLFAFLSSSESCLQQGVGKLRAFKVDLSGVFMQLSCSCTVTESSSFTESLLPSFLFFVFFVFFTELLLFEVLLPLGRTSCASSSWHSGKMHRFEPRV